MAEQLLHESGVDPKITPCARSCSAFDEWGDSLFFRPMRMFIFMSAAERRVRAESSRLVEPDALQQCGPKPRNPETLNPETPKP